MIGALEAALIILAFVVEVMIAVRIVTYKPVMSVDSWGNPDAGEACGLACVLLVALILDLLVAAITLATLFEVMK